MRTFQEQNGLSIIVPTLNEAANLGPLLAQLRPAEIVSEIVVADGGSEDGTEAIAQIGGAHFAEAPRGRGNQLAAGAAAALGKWLLFLHADCRLAAGWEERVRKFVARPGACLRAGYFDWLLDDPTTAARRLERIVAWRCRLLALPYGDQGLLIARSLYDTVGGFAPLPLMEDVDLARRLGRDRLVRIGAPVMVSARRYRRDGYVQRSLRNLCCLALYFAGVPPARLSRLYG